MSLALLHPHLRHGITHQLGWKSLRPVQSDTIPPVLAGANALILAPTAGGKTEAALFPLLSRVLSEDLSPVAILYVCPLRALLNNQEERLRSYARLVGLEAFKWHGDVSDGAKTRFRKSPAHLLLTTPESLEVMLVSERTDARALFRGLSAVVIDEVHAFAGDDRGAHLASLLERLTRLAGRDLQRLGLSATVGNPDELASWMQGSSKRASRVVNPPRPPPLRELKADWAEDVDDAARGIGQVARGKKSLVFVESRSGAEKTAHALSGRGVEVFIHHSSVSREDRALAEERFASGRNTAIVATSTLELGIDVGDLDQVVQLDAPSSVAAFLQRLGRTGRRAGTAARCTFFCLTPESLLRAAALMRLSTQGFVEDVRPPREPVHVLAHQVMALVLQERGLARGELFGWLEGAAPFRKVSATRRQALVDAMLEAEILYEADGLLTLGREGERRYGKKNFFELYAVFSSPPAVRVVHGSEEVGFLQATFASMHEAGAEPLCFRLGGRAWEVGRLDLERGVAHVRPARAGRVPSWLGLPGLLSRPLCEAMREVLRAPGPEAPWLTPSAAQELAALRAQYAPVLDEPLEALPEGGAQWHTFAGGAINRLLAAALGKKTRAHWVAGNLSLKCKDVTEAQARAAMAGLARVKWAALAEALAPSLARGPVGKFEPCLPEVEARRVLAGKLLDVEGTRAFVGG